MSLSATSIEQLAINTIRTLSMDAVQKANSGHPGTPMALAPVTYALWNHVLRYDPKHPQWPARDRFVLSCGHASMLLYSTLHLAGVRKLDATGAPIDELSITLEDIRNFRQLHSPCAGHPEFGEAAGIETTTGPLGQGIGNSVGMAIASRWLAARYNQSEFDLFGFNVYAICSDGDLMEGVGSEAASLAGHLKLANLCWIYDDNQITIEGATNLAFSEHVAQRFQGFGWQTIEIDDANDLGAIESALKKFAETHDRPTLIVLRSIIGYGSPNKANTHGAHGAPLGDDEIKKTKQVYGWPEDAHFHVPDEVRTLFAEQLGTRGGADYEQWQKQFAEYAACYPELADQLKRIWTGQPPVDGERGIPEFPADAKGLATRVSSGKVLNALAPHHPWLLGGSADLAPSTMTMLNDESMGHFSSENYAGRNFHFGIREHGMAAACNGMALTGLRPYGATFFVFTDYMRPSMRLSALMRLGVIYVLTHDSIGLGEDGPTHQPVEHLAACRSIPRLMVFRPCDANEVAEVYRTILPIHNRPAALVLTRQNVPTLDRTVFEPATGVSRGAYILSEAQGGIPELILLGTGSEVHLCLAAQKELESADIPTRVVSMVCFELFDEQDETYRQNVLPPTVTARVGVEAGIRLGWDKYLGVQGAFIGMSEFGASAPFQALYEHFGITTERVIAAAREVHGS